MSIISKERINMSDELKIDIKKLCDIEFICNKCKTKITFDFTKRKMMFEGVLIVVKSLFIATTKTQLYL